MNLESSFVLYFTIRIPFKSKRKEKKIMKLCEDAWKMNILRAWHFKSCCKLFLWRSFISRFFVLMFRESNAVFCAMCNLSLNIVFSQPVFFLLTCLACCHQLFFRATITLGLPPCVNNCDINLKGFFSYYGSMAWESKKMKKKKTLLRSWTPWLDFHVNRAIAGSFWRGNWNDSDVIKTFLTSFIFFPFAGYWSWKANKALRLIAIVVRWSITSQIRRQPPLSTISRVL